MTISTILDWACNIIRQANFETFHCYILVFTEGIEGDSPSTFGTYRPCKDATYFSVSQSCRKYVIFLKKLTLTEF